MLRVAVRIDRKVFLPAQREEHTFTNSGISSISVVLRCGEVSVLDDTLPRAQRGERSTPSLNPGLILFLVVPRLRGAQQLGYERFRRSVSSRREEYVRANLIKICINSPSADGAQIWGTVSFSPRACPCVFYL